MFLFSKVTYSFEVVMFCVKVGELKIYFSRSFFSFNSNFSNLTFFNGVFLFLT